MPWRIDEMHCLGRLPSSTYTQCSTTGDPYYTCGKLQCKGPAGMQYNNHDILFLDNIKTAGLVKGK